jgi:tetratricopeptide (TPR) repeat protein
LRSDQSDSKLHHLLDKLFSVSTKLSPSSSTPVWGILALNLSNGKYDQNDIDTSSFSDERRVRLISEVINREATICINGGYYSSAEVLLNKFINHGIESAELFESLAVSLRNQRKYQSAIEAYYRAVKLDPEKEPRYLLEVAQIYDEDIKDQDQAKAVLLRVIDLNSGKQPTWQHEYERMLPYLLLGNIYRLQGFYDEALAAYQTIIQLDKSDAWLLYHAWAYTGLILIEREEYEKAIQAETAAIPYDPTSPWPHIDLGNVYFQLQDYESALDQYQIALSLDSKLDDGQISFIENRILLIKNNLINK